MDGRCKTCRWYVPCKPDDFTVRKGTHPDPEVLMTCISQKIQKSYGVLMPDDDGIVVENDEGWGILVGPDFGCVNWETP